MVPPGGAATFGTLGWTIQPTGTRFDPPAQVKIPNPGHMSAGQTAQIVQWDHDLATFIPMGRGTVSEDASQIITDFGSGITKAGWGGCAGGCPPDPGFPQCVNDKKPEIDFVKIGIKRHPGEPSELSGPAFIFLNTDTNKAENTILDAYSIQRNCNEVKYEWKNFLGATVYTGTPFDTTRFILPSNSQTFTVTASCATCAGTPISVDSLPKTVHFVKYSVDSAFSEQFKGAYSAGWTKAGYAGGNSTKPYVLTGTNSENLGCLRVDLKLEGEDDAKIEFRKKFMGTMYSAQFNESDVKSGPHCGESGAFDGDQLFLSIPAPTNETIIPKFGFDDNSDNKLAFNEIIISRPQWRFNIVDEDAFADALDIYNSRMTAFVDLGQSWLRGFRDGTVPFYGSSADIVTAHNLSRIALGLTHSVGMEYDSSDTFLENKTGKSRYIEYTGSPLASSVVSRMMYSANLSNWVVNAIDRNRDRLIQLIGSDGAVREVNVTFSNMCGQTVNCLPASKATFFQDLISNIDPDMYASIGDALEIKATLLISGRDIPALSLLPGVSRILQIQSIRIMSGYVRDIFDWDRDVAIYGVSLTPTPFIGDLPIAAAEIQAYHLGISSARKNGLVFEAKYIMYGTSVPGFGIFH